MSDLYTGKINEFVDWVSGENSFTGENDTGGLEVSGASIRELLQSRLKVPFCIIEDPENNKYRMFSSREAYNLWLENPTDNADLELFNFVRPSDYKLELTATDPNGFNNKYIRLGDSNNSAARIAFHWNIYNDELVIDISIPNNSKGISVFTSNDAIGSIIVQSILLL